ncbi:MAG: fructose-bisphosphatase class III, partial [Ruminococcus sp.]|nr:fructose-bisphosphatase class III [Ruminococcus sp.]
MIYCMSDIHGNYESYLTILRMIDLRDSDTLYILGDVIDRGYGGMNILLNMMEKTNIIPLLGNHDVLALRCLDALYRKPERTLQVMDDIDLWLRLGGTPTL